MRIACCIPHLEGSKLGRFDREDNNSEGMSTPSGSPTDKLRSMLERHVREVVDEAMTRATKIEERARVHAVEIEQEAQQNAREVLKDSNQKANDTIQASIDRTEGVLGAIETLHSELEKVISAFREEVEALATDLNSAKASFAPPEPEPPAPEALAPPAAPAAVVPDPATNSQSDAPQAEAPVPPPAAPQDATPAPASEPETETQVTRRRGLLRRG
jgi:DNA replication initiation complex subunit (GINS family)